MKGMGGPVNAPPSQAYMSQGRKPGDNLTASGAGDVEALNKILNNINVQTKKNEQLVDGKLPRKHLLTSN
jgi:hypothetical protein